MSLPRPLLLVCRWNYTAGNVLYESRAWRELVWGIWSYKHMFRGNEAKNGASLAQNCRCSCLLIAGHFVFYFCSLCPQTVVVCSSGTGRSHKPAIILLINTRERRSSGRTRIKLNGQLKQILECKMNAMQLFVACDRLRVQSDQIACAKTNWFMENDSFSDTLYIVSKHQLKEKCAP